MSFRFTGIIKHFGLGFCTRRKKVRTRYGDRVNVVVPYQTTRRGRSRYFVIHRTFI
jgi:hypothetical protein